MKNKLTRKLMLSAFTLLFAVISLGASTYAWFTMSNTAKINAFQGQVKAGQGIEIAVTKVGVNPSEWFTGEIASDKIQEAVVASGFSKFDAVTSVDGKTFQGIGSDHVVDENVDNTKYIEFNLHFRAAEAGNLSLTSMEFDTQNAVAKQNDQEFKLASDQRNVTSADKLLFKVQSAARVSLTLGDQNAVIYQDNQKNSTESEGVIDAGNDLDFDTTNGAFAYYNAKSYKVVEGNKQGNLVAPDSSKIPSNLKTLENAKDSIQIDLPAYDYNTPNHVTLTVRVWIEGWDGECLNYIFSQILFVSMAFDFKPTNQG